MMATSLLFCILAASLWRLCVATDAFTFPNPGRSGTDYVPTQAFCLDQRITIRWSMPSEPSSTTLGMILWQVGATRTPSYSMYTGPNTGSYTWSVDTGEDYTKAPFYFAMYVAGQTQLRFTSEIFNISNCPASQSPSSPSPSLTTSTSRTPSPSGSTSLTGPTSPAATVTPNPVSNSGSASVSSTPVSVDSAATRSSVATVVNPSPAPAGGNDGHSMAAPLQAVMAGVLGLGLFAAL